MSNESVNSNEHVERCQVKHRFDTMTQFVTLTNAFDIDTKSHLQYKHENKTYAPFESLI
jgi:hypothetical protein